MNHPVGSSHRREALASRRAARESASQSSSAFNGNQRSSSAAIESSRTIPIHESNKDEGDTNWRHRSKRVPLQNNLLVSLSRALNNIDAANNRGQTGCSADIITGSMEDRPRYNKSKAAMVSTNPPQSFSSYLSFTRSILQSLLIFTCCYLLLFACCLPMLTSAPSTSDNKKSTMGDAELKLGQSFQNIRGRQTLSKVVSSPSWGTMKQRATEWERNAKVTLEEMENAVLESSTVGRRDGVDAAKAGRLMEEAVLEFESEASDSDVGGIGASRGFKGHDHWEEALKSWDNPSPVEEQQQQQQLGAKNIHMNADTNENNAAEDRRAIYKGLHGNQKPGFMVLGMHRSGTSMLSGLLVQGFGYETGGPLIGANFDNEKGFYERLDIVLQNDEFFSAQHMSWAANVYHYNSEKALQHKQQGVITFKEGKKGLQFLNNPHKEVPYLQKDPRMCIALPTWLELVDHPPAVVYTYRHPLEVAMSLSKREEGFTLSHGLRLWIVYNMRAVQNSSKLCRVFSTNEAVMKNPLGEVQRIKDELTSRCNVIPPPVETLQKSVVDQFVDAKLQHNKEKPDGETVKDGCVAPKYTSDYEEGSDGYKEEKEVFFMAMEIFCDLESGDALDVGYGWPDLETMKWPSKVH